MPKSLPVVPFQCREKISLMSLPCDLPEKSRLKFVRFERIRKLRCPDRFCSLRMIRSRVIFVSREHRIQKTQKWPVSVYQCHLNGEREVPSPPGHAVQMQTRSGGCTLKTDQHQNVYFRLPDVVTIGLNILLEPPHPLEKNLGQKPFFERPNTTPDRR
jgi:hypothetical protein